MAAPDATRAGSCAYPAGCAAGVAGELGRYAAYIRGFSFGRTLMQDKERVGDNPNFYFMSAVCNLAICALLAVWWGRTIIVCGIGLALFYCGRGLLLRHKIQRRKSQLTSGDSDAV